MMLTPRNSTRVYLCLGHTDMRKAINGLTILAEEYLEQDPFSGHFFVFCNRRRNMLKILWWDRNGFCLFQKRLEKHRFKWPEKISESMGIDYGQLLWLLDGLDIGKTHGHASLNYTIAY